MDKEVLAPPPDVMLLSIDQAAYVLNISRRHLRDLISEGKIKTVGLGTCVRISREEIERVVKGG